MFLTKHYITFKRRKEMVKNVVQMANITQIFNTCWFYFKQNKIWKNQLNYLSDSLVKRHFEITVQRLNCFWCSELWVVCWASSPRSMTSAVLDDSCSLRWSLQSRVIPAMSGTWHVIRWECQASWTDIQVPIHVQTFDEHPGRVRRPRWCADLGVGFYKLLNRVQSQPGCIHH